MNLLIKIEKIKNWFLKRSLLNKGLILLFFLVLGFLTYSTFFKKSGGNQIQTQKAEKGTIVSSLSASGTILTANIVNITTNTKGLVKAVYVTDGDEVFKGQKILELTLDSDAQQKETAAYASYLSAKNSLDSTLVNLYTLDSAMWSANQKLINDAVSRNLTIDNPTYIQEHDDWLAAEAKYKNQQAVISQARVSLSSAWLSYQTASSSIYAPQAGIIDNLTYSPGMTISATTDSSQRIAVIKAEGMPLGSFNLSEIDVSKVKIGQKAIIKLDSLSGKTFTGRVKNVDRIGSSTSGVTNYPVVIQFDTESEEILPNMSATATIILETKENVTLIPNSAIQMQGEQNFVRILKDGKEQTISVETGLASETETEILSGISEGDEVIVSTTNQETLNRQGGTSVFGGARGGQMFINR